MSISITVPSSNSASQFSGFGNWSQEHGHANYNTTATHSERPPLNVDCFTYPCVNGAKKLNTITSLNSALKSLRSGELKKDITKTADPSLLTKKSSHFASRVLFSTNQPIKHQ